MSSVSFFSISLAPNTETTVGVLGVNGHHPKLEMAGREQVGWRTAEGRAERLRVRCRLERDWAVVTVEGGQ